MKHAIVALLLTVTQINAMEPAKPSIIRRNPEHPVPFEVVCEEVTADGSACTVVFRAPRGIFSCFVDLSGTKFQKLTFVIQQERFWEGVQFFPTGQEQAEPIDLRHAEGVTISQVEEDVVIEFRPAAIELLKQGGKFQFINQYRG